MSHRCTRRLGAQRCLLVRDHPGFGHVFRFGDPAGPGTAILDEPWPLADDGRPNWLNTPYPLFRTPLGR